MATSKRKPGSEGLIKRRSGLFKVTYETGKGIGQSHCQAGDRCNGDKGQIGKRGSHHRLRLLLGLGTDQVKQVFGNYDIQAIVQKLQSKKLGFRDLRHQP